MQSISFSALLDVDFNIISCWFSLWCRSFHSCVTTISKLLHHRGVKIIDSFVSKLGFFILINPFSPVYCDLRILYFFLGDSWPVFCILVLLLETYKDVSTFDVPSTALFLNSCKEFHREPKFVALLLSPNKSYVRLDLNQGLAFSNTKYLRKGLQIPQQNLWFLVKLITRR